MLCVCGGTASTPRCPYHMRYNSRMLGKIVRSGNSFVIRVPREEMERIGVDVDEYVTVDIHRADIRPQLTTDLEPLVEARLAQPETAAAFDLLANA